MKQSLCQIYLSLTMFSLLGFVTSHPAAASGTYTVQDLGTLGGGSSDGRGINNSGQVVGGSSLPGDTEFVAFRTAPNSAINPATDNLGTFGSGFSEGLGINNSGQVVGRSNFNGSRDSVAFRTAPNSAINPATDNLGSLGGTNSQANGINNSGQVVGSSSLLGDTTIHAFRTAPNSAINPATDNLGSLGGTYSFGSGINNSGQVVGSSEPLGNTTIHAFRTAPNSAINPATDDLGSLGDTISEARGINNSGQLVGDFQFPVGYPFSHALLYSNGKLNDLNNLVASKADFSSLDVAFGINDSGQIVGNGTLIDGRTIHAFLATPTESTPVPAPPSTLGLLTLIAGFGGSALKHKLNTRRLAVTTHRKKASLLRKD